MVNGLNPLQPINESSLNKALSKPEKGGKLYLGSRGFVVVKPEQAGEDLKPVTEGLLKKLSKDFKSPPSDLMNRCQPFLSPEREKTAAVAGRVMTPTPSTFVQKQLKYIPTENPPKAVLEGKREGSSCITRVTQENTHNYSMHVVINGEVKAFPMTASEEGISIVIDGKTLGPVESLRDLFQMNGCPATHIHYDRQPKTLGEHYYWDMLPKMWTGGHEWASSTFLGHEVVASTTGIITTKKVDIAAFGSFHDLHKLDILPSSVETPGLLYSVSRGRTEESRNEEVATLKDMKARYKNLNIKPKYCLVPTIVTHLNPPLHEDEQTRAVSLHATAGDLKSIERDLELSGRYSGLMDILLGIQEQDEIGMCHRDLKMANVVAMSSNLEKPELRLIDLGDNFPKDDIPRKLILSAEMVSPAVSSEYTEAGGNHRLDADHFLKDSLYSWGAIAYELMCDEQPHFGRDTEEDYRRGDVLNPEDLVNDFYFEDGNPQFDSEGRIVWDPTDSMERLVWDAMMWEHASDDGKIAHRLTLADAQTRLRALARKAGDEAVASAKPKDDSLKIPFYNI